MSFILDNIDTIFWVSSVITVIILLIRPPRPLTRSEAIKKAQYAESHDLGIMADYIYRYQHRHDDTWP